MVHNDEDSYPYEKERARMVKDQLKSRDIVDPGVLAAMRAIPRHQFVPRKHRPLAYTDGPLPIGEDQTISQPYIVALMTQLLDLRGEEKVLEVGTGSGYQAAILGYLAREVHTVERHQPLAEKASKALYELGFDNIYVHVGDGTLGWPAAAPYEGIVVTAAAPHAPQPLLEQLAEGGRMVIPVGRPGNQFLERWVRNGSDFAREAIAPVAFVPLLGQFGWEESW
jgi:protein-L-isoaspartate(D-aspartate) O-methyltransferase